MKLESKIIAGQRVWFRHNDGKPSSDERALTEVIQQHCYRRVRLGFDVEPGEHWLDLGANIGSFAVYCKLRGAVATCFEPEPTAFEILNKNAKGFQLYHKAVTAARTVSIPFYVPGNNWDHYRGTIYQVRGYKFTQVPNFWAGDLKKLKKFDGIKMDIEGSEGVILDQWLLPPVEKLVMEYHTSRDSSGVNLARRLKILRKHYKHLHYPKMFDIALAKGQTLIRPRFDRFIYAWGLK